MNKLAIASALLIGTAPVVANLAQPEQASAYHWTNKRDVRKSIKKGGWTVIYSKEFSHAEWGKLATALTVDYFGGSGSATTAYLYSFADSSYEKFTSNLRSSGPEAERQLRKVFTKENFARLIQNALKNKRVEWKNLPGIRVKVGKATYNRAECLKFFGSERCVSTPNTHQPYVAFKLTGGDFRTPKKRTPSKWDGKPVVRQVRACNKTTYPIWVAYGAAGSDRRMKVHGWRKLNGGECDTLIRSVTGTSLFFRAEDADGGFWGNKIKICANPSSKFKIPYAIRNCPSGTKLLGFNAHLITEPTGTYTRNFTD